MHNHYIQMSQRSMNNKGFVLYYFICLVFVFTWRILGFEKLEIVTDFNFLSADDSSFINTF